MNARAIIGLVVVVNGGLAAAGEAQDKPEKRGSFSGDIGFVNAAGNTSVTTFNVGDKLTLNTAGKQLIFTQLFTAVYGETEGEKSAENYLAQVRLDQRLGNRLYLFGLVGWDRNPFGGIARRFEETVGLAYKALASATDELGFEVGVSLFQQRNTTSEAGTIADNYTAGRLGALYKHGFHKTAFFTQALEFIPSFETGADWRLNSETALVAPLSTNIAFKVGYVVRYDNLPGLRPPPNPLDDRFKKTDRFLTTGITLSY